jgi:hypothetical protein
MATFDEMKGKDALLDAMHVDAEGKRETVDSKNLFSSNTHGKVDKFFLDNRLGSFDNNTPIINRFNSTKYTNFHTEGVRIVIFPFHTFL